MKTYINKLPDVVHPVEPGLKVVIRDDFEPSLSDSIGGLLPHVCAVHIPLRLQQRLDDVLGATDGGDKKTCLKKMIINRMNKPETQMICVSIMHS